MSRHAVCFAVLLIAGAVTTGCDSGRQSSRGFRLPVYGDIERGKIAFVERGCSKCHRVSGVDLPAPTAQPAVPVVLGGETSRELTDGYLVTSIINPSHAIAGHPRELTTVAAGKSRMPEYTDDMTVRELTDIVMFLQSRYVVRRPAREQLTAY